MPTQARLAKTEPSFYMIQRMPTSLFAAKQHFGDVDGIDALNFSGAKTVAVACGGKELGIKALAVVGDEGGRSGPDSKVLENLIGPRRIGDVMVADPGVTLQYKVTGNMQERACVF